MISRSTLTATLRAAAQPHADIATARVRELGAGLRAMVTLRRHEKRVSTYALRLLCMALILVVLPVKKAVQLGVLGTVLAAVKIAFAVALVGGALWLYFAIESWMRRKGGAA